MLVNRLIELHVCRHEKHWRDLGGSRDSQSNSCGSYNSRVPVFSHDARRNPCMFVVSWRSAMNFAREPFFAEPRRKSGSRWRSALATTNSDGGMPGRMVRSHDPNESQTSLGATTARYWSRPWATTPA